MSSPTILADEGTYVTMNSLNLHNQVEKIKPIVYRVGVKDECMVLLKDRDKFDIPSRLFGQHIALRKKIVSTYGETPGALGALLIGLKGSGKSLLAEDMINEVMKTLQRPCVMIDGAVTETAIKKIIRAIGPCVLYFDEFGKHYKEEDREKMLTLFSDSSLKGVMFIVTANHTHELSDYMIHRPGRFLYKIDFSGMEEEAIMEVLEELKLSPAILSYILDYCKCHRISFDMLRVVARVATGARDLKEFKTNLKIHNVPSEAFAVYQLQETTWKGQKAEADISILELADGKLRIELRDPKSNDLLDSGEFEWMIVDKSAIGGAESNEWRVVVSETITVKIHRTLSPYKQPPRNNQPPSMFDKDGKVIKRPHRLRSPNGHPDPWGQQGAQEDD